MANNISDNYRRVMTKSLSELDPVQLSDERTPRRRQRYTSRAAVIKDLLSELQYQDVEFGSVGDEQQGCCNCGVL